MIRRFRQGKIRRAFLLLSVNLFVSISEVNGEEKKFRYNTKNTPKIKTSKCRKVFKAKEIFSRVDFGKKECRNHKDENKNFGGKISHLWQDNLMKIPYFLTCTRTRAFSYQRQAHVRISKAKNISKC